MEITPKQQAQRGKKIRDGQLQTLKKSQVQCDFFPTKSAQTDSSDVRMFETGT